jgi:hypothetical protein
MTTIKNTLNGIIECKFRKFLSIYIDYALRIVQLYTLERFSCIKVTHTEIWDGRYRKLMKNGGDEKIS